MFISLMHIFLSAFLSVRVSLKTLIFMGCILLHYIIRILLKYTCNRNWDLQNIYIFWKCHRYHNRSVVLQLFTHVVWVSYYLIIIYIMVIEF
jgi:hypothetical protein